MNFKQEVLDLLGLSFNINPNNIKDKDLRKKAKEAALTKSSAKENPQINKKVIELVTYEIDNRIRNAKKEDREQMENSIQSFTIQDLLANSSGNSIKTGFKNASTYGYRRRAEANNDDFVNTIKKSYKNGIDIYLAKETGANKNYIKETDENSKPEILKYYDGNILIKTNEKFSGLNYNIGPREKLEEILISFYGGEPNLGKNDAVRDITIAGNEMSIKAYKKGQKVTFNKDDAENIIKLADDRKIELVVYNYEVYTNKREYIYLLKKDKNQCGTITNNGIDNNMYYKFNDIIANLKNSSNNANINSNNNINKKIKRVASVK